MELIDINGIGEIRKKSLEESGIFSTEDLVNFFPYKYYDFTKTEPFASDGNVRLIKATIIQNATIIKVRTGLSFVSCKVCDEIGHEFNAVWYNQTYIKSTLFLGEELYLYGKNSPTKKNTFVVILSKKVETQKLGFLPVYHSVPGIGQNTLNDAIFFVLDNLLIDSVIPNNLLIRYNLTPLVDAYREIHNPTTELLLTNALDRVEIENLIPLIAINEFNRIFYRNEKLHRYFDTIKLKAEYENLLPFKLTIDQNNAIYDLEKDFSSKFSMNRMIQGDVGSGKTAVAFFGAFLSAKNGYQSAIVAPTEILAKQHFDFASKIFKDTNIKVVFLTSSLSTLERKALLDEINSGKAQIVIGTHSVFSNDVYFKNLTYIVIDEQHRFGVEQRKKLREKGSYPDILVMSATPIPRTLSLVVYGDLDMTIITSRPKPIDIKTNIVPKTKTDAMWQYVKTQIEEHNSKVYVVCSKIDEENENETLKAYSAKNMYNFLCSKFDKNIIGYLHGKLKKENQNKIIEDFKQNKIKILVSTTIVEVGVDIPDADLMVIATPERFGLATLHQLRGRIGRNGQTAYCFCLSDNLNEKSFERLNYFKNHLNGFEIAEFDALKRGSGSIFGINQHGNDNNLLSRLNSTLYGTAKEILEQIKKDKTLFMNVLSKGDYLYNKNILGKVILN